MDDFAVSLAAGARATQMLLGLSVIIQTFEFLRLRAPLGPRGVWAFSVQSADLAHASPLTQSIFAFLARERVHHAHLLLRLAAAVLLIIGVPSSASLPLMAFLFLGTIAILIRWRGAFNGGSDFMTVVVLTGALIAAIVTAFTDPETGWRAGLWYIAIHAISSYFISGSVKLLNAEWRTGEALPIFLDGGIYGPLAPDSPFRKRPVAVLCSWGFILWECSFPLALLSPIVALAYCTTALVFHFLVFWFFGLNRFFFAWFAALPSILFASTQF